MGIGHLDSWLVVSLIVCKIWKYALCPGRTDWLDEHMALADQMLAGLNCV